MNILKSDRSRLIKTIVNKTTSLRLSRILKWFSLAVVIFVGIAILTFFSKNINQTAKFRDQVITDQSEGSLSENLGLLTMLETEISSYLDLESESEKRKAEKIKAYLMDLKGRIEQLEPPQTSLQISDKSNIEKETDEERLKSWLHPDSLAKINSRNLNLVEQYPPAHPTRPYLLSSDKDKEISIKSFVFIPTPLVPVENGKIELSTTVKKEVVFSKIIETDLLQIFNAKYLQDVNIWQLYFIPVSGFVRLFSKDSENLIENYKDQFSGIVCFSDRPYFRKTMADQEGFRISNPYIDSASNGIIVTYSVFIRNTNLDIVGMIGVDRKIGNLKDILKKVKLGSGSIYKDFQYSTHPLEDKECGYCHTGKYGDKFDYKYMRKNFQNEALSLAIAEAMENPNKWFKDDLIARMEFPGRESIVYLIYIGKNQESGKNEMACFHFNPRYTQRKYLYLYVFYGSTLFVIIFLLLVTLRSLVIKAKTKRLHIEVVSNIKGGLIIVDGEGCIKFHNRKMAELVEVSKLNERNFLSDFLPIESKAEYEELLKTSREGFEFAGRIKRVDGTVFPAIISSASIYYPGVSNAQMVIIIPSELLEGTIAANFIHVFSHALKTPLSGILLLADRLRRKNLPQPKFDQYFHMMKQQVDEFTTMVTNLLRFSKLEIEDVRPNKEHTNLSALLRSAVKPFREKATKANIILTENIPESLPASIDRDMFRVILNNLLENALKYTHDGEVSVDATEIGSEILISISDTGIGVPEDEVEKIFDKFYRGKEENVRVKDGIGIGLYVSNRYVKLHSGILTYEPNKKIDINQKGKTFVTDKGSKFIVRIPKE